LGQGLLAAGELHSFIEPTVKAFERPILVQSLAQTELIGDHQMLEIT
jgi:hypothetical protein